MINFFKNIYFNLVYKTSYQNYESIIQMTLLKNDQQKNEFKNIVKVFLKASQHRKNKRENVTITLNGKVVQKTEWNVYELSQLLNYINKQRVEKYNLSPVSLDSVIKIDEHFEGYSDYFRKVCFYCTKLVLEPEQDVFSYMRG